MPTYATLGLRFVYSLINYLLYQIYDHKINYHEDTSSTAKIISNTEDFSRLPFDRQREISATIENDPGIVSSSSRRDLRWIAR